MNSSISLKMSHKRYFSSAFRRASPMRGPSVRNAYIEYSDDEEDSLNEVSEEAIRKMTESIERLTELARRESFSSINSTSGRQQFTTALNSLQQEVFGDSLHPTGEKKEAATRPERFESTVSVQYSNSVQQLMDSPNDLSPNDNSESRTQLYGNQHHISQENIIDSDLPEGVPPVAVAPTSTAISSPQRSEAMNTETNRNAEALAASLSSQDSDSSNGFVKVEHPVDLLGEYSSSDGNVPPISESPQDLEHTPAYEASPLSPEMEDFDKTTTLTREGDLGESTYEKIVDTANTGFEKVAASADAAFKVASDAAHAAQDKTAELAHAIHDKFDEAAQAAKEKSDEVIELVSDTAEEVGKRTSDVAHGAYDTAAQAAETAKVKVEEAAHDAYEKAANVVHDVGNKAKDEIELIHDEANKISDDAQNVASAAFDAATKATEEMKEKVTDFAHDTEQRIADINRAAAEKAKEASHAVAGKAEEAAHVAADKVGEAGHTVAGKAEEAVHAATGKAEEAAHIAADKTEEAVNVATGKVEEAVHAATGKAEEAAHVAADKVGEAGHAVAGKAEEVVHAAIGKAEEAVHAATGKAEEAVHAATGKAEEAGHTFADKAEEVVLAAAGKAEEAGHAVSNATQEAFHLVTGDEKEKNLAAAAYDNVAHAFDEFDPLKQQSNAPQQDDHNDERKPEDKIRDEVADVHNEVDSVIQKIQEVVPQAASLDTKHEGEHDVTGNPPPHGREVSPEEHTFERQGPLTIPEHAPKNTDVAAADDSLVHLDNEPEKHHGFDIKPRPPTPPKELDDEEVKPRVIDVGPPPVKNTAPYSADQPRSILKHSQGSWLGIDSVDPRLLDLIYWRDWKKSAVVLCLTLLTLLVFAKFPLILIVSYVSLAVLTGTLGFRLYKAVEAQIKGQAHSNPFKPFLEKDFDLPKDRLREQIGSLIEHVQVIAKQLRRLILVEDIVDSIKFGLLLWALTYVGSWFSGLCLIILAVLGIFSIPKFYEVYQEPIDKNLTIAKEQIDKATNMAFEKVPFLKKFAHEKTN